MSVDNRVALEAVVGSTAYGLNHADSDIDRLGIFVEPTEALLRLSVPEPTFTSNNPDITYHEVGKFCRLAMKGNPTVLELLFMEKYLQVSDDGHELLNIRDSFLGQKAIRAAYIGYATSQIKRLESRGDFGSDLKKRYAKHARHCFRLLLQAEQLLTTGTMHVRVTPEQREYLFSLGDMSIENLSEQFEDKVQVLDHIVSDLPETADTKTINDTLLAIRRRNYDL